MTPLENLHSAIGELAYAMARADGQIQRQEAAKFLNIVTSELADENYEFDVAHITYKLMTRDKMDPETTYEWAIKEIKTNSHYLSPKLKEKFIKVMEEVAKAFQPVTQKEMNLLEKFKNDIAPIVGDPVYYEQNHIQHTRSN